MKNLCVKKIDKFILNGQWTFCQFWSCFYIIHNKILNLKIVTCIRRKLAINVKAKESSNVDNRLRIIDWIMDLFLWIISLILRKLLSFLFCDLLINLNLNLLAILFIFLLIFWLRIFLLPSFLSFTSQCLRIFRLLSHLNLRLIVKKCGFIFFCFDNFL